MPQPFGSSIVPMAPPNARQESALRRLLEARTEPESDARVKDLDRALVEGRPLHLTPGAYEVLLAPVIRLRLRRALMHALTDGVVTSPAAAQILGYFSDERSAGSLEELFDVDRFPNLASPDFAFLREIKQRLRQDVLLLKAAAGADR